MPSDLEKLQGSWQLAASEVDGVAFAPEQLANARIVITGDHFESLGMGAAYSGTFVIDDKAKPKGLDMVITGGHAAGTRHAGVYKFAKGAWTLCLAAAGAPRPKKFACSSDGGFAMQTFRRAEAASPSADFGEAANVSTTPSDARTTAIDGEWAMLSGVFNGAAMADDMVKWCTRVSRGDITKVLAGPNVMLEARFTLDDAATPWSVDYMNLRGALKGKAQYGIADLSGDTLRVCMSPPGHARPSAFTSSPGDNRSLTTWRRLG